MGVRRTHGLDEAQLRSLSEALLDAADMAELGLVVYVGGPAGPQGIFASNSAARLLGYEVSELVGVPLLPFLVPEDVARAEDRWRRRLAGEALPPTFEVEVFRKDGSRLPLELAVSQVTYEGRPAVVSFMRDITERRRAEASLVQTDRLATVGTLAAGVAHEINNPLAYVLLNLGFLERELAGLVAGDADRERVMQMVQAAREGTERVAVIVRDLRSVSRADGEGQRFVDVRRVVESALNIATNEIRRRARLVTALDDLPAVHGNEGRLGQVFLNLLLNAAHAIPAGRDQENEVRVDAWESAPGRVSVRVRDTGTGIAPELIPRIFDPFFTTKPPGLGTGLGLSICQNIVTSMGGTIDVDSAPGRGTTFTVTLPASEGVVLERDRLPERPTTAQLRRLRGMRVLIVDDEPALAYAIRDAVGGEHDVTAVTSGEEALDLALRERFDVILCDLVMPRVDGKRLYEELRLRVPGAERRIVFTTGADSIPWAAEFLAKVPNPRVIKPFDASAIRGALAAFLEDPPARESRHGRGT